MNSSYLRIEFLYGLHLLGLLCSYPLLLAAMLLRNILFFGKKRSVIKGEVAIVTGGAQGLGREISVELAKLQCKIAIVDINEKLAKETADFLRNKYKIQSQAYKADISNYDDLLELRTKVTQDLGNCTILINNAGLIFLSDVNQPAAHEIQKLVNVNFTSHLLINEIFLPKMKELNHGFIVAICSLAALFPTGIFKFYAPTKAAVRNYMSALRMSLKNQNSNIILTTVMPTFLTTNQPTKEIITASRISDSCPLLDGQYVAQNVVRAMLEGVEELCLPRVTSWTYKLIEILPSYLRDKICIFVNGSNWNRIESSADISKLLKQN